MRYAFPKIQHYYTILYYTKFFKAFNLNWTFWEIYTFSVRQINQINQIPKTIFFCYWRWRLKCLRWYENGWLANLAWAHSRTARASDDGHHLPPETRQSERVSRPQLTTNQCGYYTRTLKLSRTRKLKRNRTRAFRLVRQWAGHVKMRPA